MKKYMLIFLFLLILPSAWALKGVGLQWYMESVKMAEGETTCVNYGVYNPWDEDITLGLVVSGDIEQFAKLPGSEFVPAGTESSNAIPMKICFKIPRVYDKNCKLGSFMCEHDCSESITYTGEVKAVEKASMGKTRGTGSATAASVAADLDIKVTCTEKGVDWLIFIPIILISITAAVLLVLKWPTAKRKREKYMSLYGDLQMIRAELEADVHNIEKRAKYTKLWNKLKNLRKKL